MSRSISENHAELIKIIDGDFEMCKLLMGEYRLNYESNPPYSWLVTRGKESLEITFVEGMHTVKFNRNTKLANDEIVFSVYAENMYDKYWSHDLYYLVDEAFGVGSFLRDSDMTDAEKRRFYSIAKSLLRYIGEDPERLLSNVNRHNMKSYSIADLLKGTLQSFAIKKVDKETQRKCYELLEQFRALDDHDKYSRNKLTLMLDGCEQII